MVAKSLLAVLVSFAAQVTSWEIEKVTSVVAFGDSYTDEGRLGYFISHNGAAPPVGYQFGESTTASSGGRVWARFAASSLSANLYNYAVSGAVCSNDITPRYFSAINASFPAVLQYEVPAFVADAKYRGNNSKPALDIPAKETVYALWIGTNDLGNDALLTDSQIPGKTVVDYVECVFQTFDKIYSNGGRYFVILNVAPLNLLPQYALPSQGGLNATQFWKNKGPNITEISYRMAETIAAVNELFLYRAASAVQLEDRYVGAHVALFDTNALITDLYEHPSRYFNISMNVTGYINHCPLDGGACIQQMNPASYLWYDPLHPSEATDKVVAKHFVDVVRGRSKFAQYYS